MKKVGIITFFKEKNYKRIYSAIVILCILVSFTVGGFCSNEVIIKGIIDKDIGNEFIRKLEKANENEKVYLYIKSCGGSLKEGLKIIEAMKNSKAEIIVEIVDYVESLAAIIALFADKVYIRPDAIIMFHLPRTNNGVVASLNSNNLRHRELATIVVNWILTKKQVMSVSQWERFMSGEDIFITGDTFIQRIKEATKAMPISGESYESWRIIKCNPDYRYRSEE
ncbi:MAG: ATP-dependent Clp protease proteolytic subunit [Legionellales bacterium]|nr:ATP-dependent Clp protease proteolytic subunit [Legionellales bacterium]